MDAADDLTAARSGAACSPPGLVDERYVMVSPVLLGAGLAAFPAGTARELRLRDTRTRPDSPNVVLHYSVSHG